jgi:ribokinase
VTTTGTVIVVGSVNADLIVRVAALPAPGETVVGGSFSQAGGGKGANAAVAAARLGARVLMVAVVGDDDLGRRSRDELRAEGIDVSDLGTSELPTGVALIIVDGRGENLIAVASGANAELSGDAVADALAAVESEAAVVLANLEVPTDAVEAAAVGAADRGWRFVLNPAPARPIPPSILRRCDVLTPNEHEVLSLELGSIDALLQAGASAVAVTRGDAGVDLHRPGLPMHHQGAFPLEVVDTTGAGDAFSGALAWSLAAGRSHEEALREAAAAGALATRAVGARTSLPDREELERFLLRAG